MDLCFICAVVFKRSRENGRKRERKKEKKLLLRTIFLLFSSFWVFASTSIFASVDMYKRSMRVQVSALFSSYRCCSFLASMCRIRLLPESDDEIWSVVLNARKYYGWYNVIKIEGDEQKIRKIFCSNRFSLLLSLSLRNCCSYFWLEV